MSKAWKPKAWKSNEISKDGVFAEQGRAQLKKVGVHNLREPGWFDGCPCFINGCPNRKKVNKFLDIVGIEYY